MMTPNRLLVVTRRLGVLALFAFSAAATVGAVESPATSSPFAAAARARRAELRINGPSVFGVRPGSPFLYAIPATGARPVTFRVDGLPSGLTFDAQSGIITGRIAQAGEYPVMLRVTNASGAVQKKFTIKVGEQICLTPPMGWNSWNSWADSVSEQKVLSSARAMVTSGLAQYGWTYINIDDAWQGRRGGPHNAIQSNEKFPDMKRLSDAVHAMGLRIGLYSTPWITSYAGYVGGSADDPSGAWTQPASDKVKWSQWRLGQVSFADADARQFAEWGFDYLKYDWSPIDVVHTEIMSKALRASGRDIVFSLSNTADPKLASEWARLANCWRTTNDIGDFWHATSGEKVEPYRWGVSEIGFSQEKWTSFAGPGHWNDPDMLVVGQVGWGPKLHPTRLSQNEQYSHISLWCLLSAPLLIGCPLDQLDEFTLELLSNDEVLALNQDALGRQASRVATVGAVDIFLKPLEDGSVALGLFNRSPGDEAVLFNKLGYLGLGGKRHVRDLWRHADLPDIDGKLEATIPGHGVLLLKLTQ